jgi:hypothetical protein
MSPAVPWITIGAPNVMLELNGLTITGQADRQAACSGGPRAFVAESTGDGIELKGHANVAIHGLCIVQQIRGPGIFS